MAQDVAQGSAQAGQGNSEQSSWLTLSEAAARSGLHKEALRAKVKRGQLQGRKNNRGETLVLLPPELAMPAQPPAQGAAQAQLEQLADLVRSLEGELSELRVELAEAKAEVRTVQAVAKADIGAANDRADALAAAHEKIVAELRAALEWHRRPWWRRLLG